MKFNIKKYLLHEWGLYIKNIRIKKCWLDIELFEGTPNNIHMKILEAAKFNWQYPKNIICG